MADVDLFRDAYRNSLGRDASDEELQGWTSGQFGGGSVQDRLNQIASSDEARQRGGGTQQAPDPTPTYHGYDDPGPSQNTNGVDQDFWSSLNQSYGQYLGRSASPDEINNWWSGTYGYGKGAGGLDAFKEAIRTSAEAKGRNSGAAPSPTYMDIGYWGQQGVRPEDIFNATTGQLNAGWSRTGKGYERTAGTTTTTGTTGQPGDLQAFLKSVLTGVASPQALAALEPQLNARGIKLQKDSDGTIRGRLLMPDGSAIDVVNNGGWGQAWTYVNRGKGGGDASGGGPKIANQYSDQYTALLEMLMKQRIGQLGQPVNDPNRAMYEAALKQRADALSTGNTQLDQLLKYLQDRFTDLKGPGFTGAENEVIRTGALDPIEQDRAAAKQRVLQRLSQRGLDQNSGIAQQALMEVDKAFDAMRGTTQTQLAGTELARREDRSQRAEAIGAQIADIPDQRSREQLDVFGALDRLSQLSRSEEDARQREAISYGGALSDLGPQRLQLAMSAAGMGGNPSSLGSILTQIAGMNQNSAANDQSNDTSLWSGLGSIAAILARQKQAGLGF